MTTEEKLSKAIAFIKSIEKIDKLKYDVFDLDDIQNDTYAYCDKCDEPVNVKLHWPSNVLMNTRYIDGKVLDDLSDKAWHVLADIAE